MPAMIAALMFTMLTMTVITNSASLTVMETREQNRSEMLASAGKQYSQFVEASYRYLASSVQTGSSFDARDLVEAGLLPPSFPATNAFKQEYLALVGVYDDGVTAGLLTGLKGEPDPTMLDRAGMSGATKRSFNYDLISTIDLVDLPSSEKVLTGVIESGSVRHGANSIAYPGAVSPGVSASGIEGGVGTMVKAPAQEGYTLIVIHQNFWSPVLGTGNAEAIDSRDRVTQVNVPYSSYGDNQTIRVEAWSSECPSELGYVVFNSNNVRARTFFVGGGVFTPFEFRETRFCVPSLKSDKVNGYTGRSFGQVRAMKDMGNSVFDWGDDVFYDISYPGGKAVWKANRDKSTLRSFREPNIVYQVHGYGSYSVSSSGSMPYVNNNLMGTGAIIYYAPRIVDGTKVNPPYTQPGFWARRMQFLSTFNAIQFSAHSGGKKDWITIGASQSYAPTGTGLQWPQIGEPYPDPNHSGMEWKARYSLWSKGPMRGARHSNLGGSYFSVSGGYELRKTHQPAQQVKVPGRYQHKIWTGSGYALRNKYFDTVIPRSETIILD